MPELYYEDDSVVLVHGDCLELADLWTCADVMVTDPPYGMAYESSWNRDKRNVKLGVPLRADESTEVRDQALDAWGDRPALVFGKWTQPRPRNVRARLIWDKMVHGTGDLSIPWGPTDEDHSPTDAQFAGSRSASPSNSETGRAHGGTDRQVPTRRDC